MAERNGQHLDSDDAKADEKDLKKVKAKNIKNAKMGESNLELEALEAVAATQAKNGGEGGLISAAFTHMRTVSAFSMQHVVSEQYGDMTMGASVRKQQRSYFAGLIFGISQASMYFCYALLFW